VRQRNFKTIRLITLLVLVAGLLIVKLEQWPSTWYDEGFNLQAARNLVELGRYGIQSSEGFRSFDPLVSSGPTVILPVALVFKVLGIGLLQARVTMVMFALLSVLLFYILSGSLFDEKTTITAVLLMVAIPYFSDDFTANFLGLGRMVLGEIPNLVFVVSGSLIWFAALERKSNLLLAIAGVVFGLAAITKQHSLMVIACLIFIWLVDRLWFHQLHWSQSLIPFGISLVLVLTWSIIQAHFGASYVTQSTLTDRIITNAFIGLLSPAQIIHNLRVLFGSGFLIWGLPGLIFGISVCSRNTRKGLKRCFILLICAVWLAWFVIASIGWLRYAFLGLALTTMFTANLFVDLSAGLTFLPYNGIFNRKRRFDYVFYFRSLAVTIMIVLIVLTPLQESVKQILFGDETSPFEFAQYLDERIPRRVIIESFEPEIVFLSDHFFHQPDLRVLMKTVRHVQLGEPYPAGFYSLHEINPDYIVVGEFASWTGLYEQKLKDGSLIPVKTIGDYELYQSLKQ
jgi:4-amino-4-deoxy-L-arabinose transferase-like glycosyltransferase